jgi:hypothetical protein
LIQSGLLQALLSLIGEGRALFTKEFNTLSGPLRITLAVKVDRGEQDEGWQEEPTQH